MTNTHHPHFSVSRAAATAFLFMGIAVLVAGNGELYLGQLSGGGVTLLAYQAGAIPMISQVSSDVVVTESPMIGDIHKQFIMGMVMILGGFLFHWFYIRKHKKTPVQQAHLDAVWNGK